MILRFLTRWQRAYRSFVARAFFKGLTPSEQVAIWDVLTKPRTNLGVAFADAFQQQLDELRERLSALHPAGLDPGIVRPIETLRKLEKTLAKTRFTSQINKLVGRYNDGDIAAVELIKQIADLLERDKAFQEHLDGLRVELGNANRPRMILVSVCSQCGELWKDHGSRCGEPGTFGFSRRA